MWRALAIKELRDVSLIVAASMFAFLVWAASVVGAQLPWLGVRQNVMIPFLTGEVVGPLTIIATATAIGIGLRQSTCVLDDSSSQFLLHRPLERWRLIAFKLFIGSGIVCSLSVVTVALLCSWAAFPGNNPAPFEIWMTVPAWIAIACVTVVYQAAFLSGLRPANWFGTRLFPTIGILPVAFGIGVLSHWYLVPGILAVIAMNWILWIAIRNLADSRDYA
ncbi:hypothetical protein ACFL2H_02180 [Planctomycetota bacterium]